VRLTSGPAPVDLVTIGAENPVVPASGAGRPQFPQNASLPVSGVLQYVHVPVMTLLPLKRKQNRETRLVASQTDSRPHGETCASERTVAQAS